MKKINLLLKSLLYILILMHATIRNYASGPAITVHTNWTSCECKAPNRCSVFTISKGEKVFFCGNDDYINPDSYYWVDPGDSLNYGAVWIGTPDNVQQGVNDRGLAYDANGLPRVEVNPHPERLPVPGGYGSYPIHILHSCSTVEEVIKWVNTHRWHSYMHDQMHFADATGDAVIISAGKDGEVVFTRKPTGDGFLVSTNFNIANTSNSFGYPCWRYDLARDSLGQLLKDNKELSLNDVVSVLDYVHMAGGTSWTIMSLVADLPNGIVYLYYFHQFNRPVMLNVKEEIANPRDPGPLSKLFPEDVQKEAANRYRQIQSIARHCKIIGTTWAAIVLVSLILLFTIPVAGNRKLNLWIPVVILLGVLGLLAWLITRRDGKNVAWKTTVNETVGDIFPVTLVFLITLIGLLLLMMSNGASWPLQFALIFGLPPVLGWLVFNGLMLSPLSQKTFGAFLLQRLPQVLVVCNLGLAGIIAGVLPLLNQATSLCSLMPLSMQAILIMWVLVIPGSLAGALIVFIYESWAVRHGFYAWSILYGNKVKINTPSWRDLWWWIIVSYLVILVGIITGAILQ